jgi:hypothetical protein
LHFFVSFLIPALDTFFTGRERAMLFSILHLLALLVHLKRHPYAQTSFNHLETLSLTLLICLASLLTAYPSDQSPPIYIRICFLLLIVLPTLGFFIFALHNMILRRRKAANINNGINQSSGGQGKSANKVDREESPNSNPFLSVNVIGVTGGSTPLPVSAIELQSIEKKSPNNDLATDIPTNDSNPLSFASASATVSSSSHTLAVPTGFNSQVRRSSFDGDESTPLTVTANNNDNNNSNPSNKPSSSSPVRSSAHTLSPHDVQARSASSSLSLTNRRPSKDLTTLPTFTPLLVNSSSLSKNNNNTDIGSSSNDNSPNITSSSPSNNAIAALDLITPATNPSDSASPSASSSPSPTANADNTGNSNATDRVVNSLNRIVSSDYPSGNAEEEQDNKF